MHDKFCIQPMHAGGGRESWWKSYTPYVILLTIVAVIILIIILVFFLAVASGLQSGTYICCILLRICEGELVTCEEVSDLLFHVWQPDVWLNLMVMPFCL